MKEKEYYWIGRIVLLTGYVLLVLSAITDPWIPLESIAARTDGLNAIFNCWAIMIPVGYLIIGITTHKKSGIVCAVIATVGCMWSLIDRIVDSNGAALIPVAYVFEWISLIDHDNGLAYMIAVMLYTLIAAIAAIRLLRNRKYRALSVTLGVVTLVVWVFFALSYKGVADEGWLFAPLRNAILRARGQEYVTVTEDVERIARGIYIGLTCLAAACCITETVSARTSDTEVK